MTAGDAFDLLVIGAGINGAAIARDAALRGLRVALVDKGDIGGGTTAWSSRLIHGGLRYLEHGEVGLVRESLAERERLLRNAPHLVRPLPFLLPLYERGRRPPWMIRAGLLAYDILSPRSSLPRHRMLSAGTARALEPGLAPAGLRGAALYWDAQAEYPERLALENALDARDHGATLLTHTRVEALTREGACVTNTSEGTRTLNARVIVNASGPWLDELAHGVTSRRLVGGTKGSHIVVAPFPGASSRAVYAEAARDGRPFFVIPWLGRYLIGATDTRFAGAPDNVAADQGDIAYLLDEANRLFPGAALTRADILFSYAGVRPLPYRPTGVEGNISRRHVIYEQQVNGTPIIAIVGGKLTTQRRLAEQVVDRVCARLKHRARCQTTDTPLPGAAPRGAIERRLLACGVSAAAAARLARIYGARAGDVLALAERDAALRAPLQPGSPALRVEIAHAFAHEGAVTLADVLLRRTMLGLEPGHGLAELPAAADVAQCVLGWDVERVRAETEAYRHAVRWLRPESVVSAAYNLDHE